VPKLAVGQRPSRSKAYPSPKFHPDIYIVTGLLVQIKEALQPDGLFLGALFGGDTLFELR
jgi:NADH dehydrogenase [ubiquinone] 1 alpha subcomplex assembly factor 5